MSVFFGALNSFESMTKKTLHRLSVISCELIFYIKQLVYDTNGCSSQGFSWSPSNRYLNRSKLASARLCNNHTIIISLQTTQSLITTRHYKETHFIWCISISQSLEGSSSVWLPLEDSNALALSSCTGRCRRQYSHDRSSTAQI